MNLSDLFVHTLGLYLTPKKIFRNSKKYTTIVIWADGTKTIVRKKDGDEDSPYSAFTAALAKRLYGSGNKINKFVSMTVDPHEERKKRWGKSE